MLRRRWIALSLGAGLALLGAAGYYVWATELRWARIRPDTAFGATPPPPPPDYAERSSWAAHPDVKDPSDLVPDGVAAGAVRAADVFYVHPTTYNGKTWSSPLDRQSGSQQEKERVLATQASAFNGCCRVYAPHFREATFFSFIDRGESGTRALDLAYQDVERAFRSFIERESQGRPFIVAGHSQGALHAMRLLAKQVDGSELRERLVAAYLIGYRLPKRELGRSFAHLEPCRRARDTGCIIAWDTWAEGTEPPWWPHPIVHADAWESVRGDAEVVCVNPLSWALDGPAAPPSLHLGAIAPVRPDFRRNEHTGEVIAELGAIQPRPTGARCGATALHVDRLPDPPYRNMLSDGNYHLYDFSLFYMNIRENAIGRTRAFLERSQGIKR